MFSVGLTGGIGSGKSFVADCFQQLGAHVVDADRIARELVGPKQPALQAIQQHFGDAILLADGSLDRARLRELIFANPDAKTWLESLLHPLVRRHIVEALAESHEYYNLLVSPLLIETGQTALVDKVIVVDLDEAVQLQRACERDGADASAIRRIMAAQLSREERLAQADYIIDNGGTRDATLEQVRALHQQFSATGETPS